jgi:hypothetical protein
LLLLLLLSVPNTYLEGPGLCKSLLLCLGLPPAMVVVPVVVGGMGRVHIATPTPTSAAAAAAAVAAAAGCGCIIAAGVWGCCCVGAAAKLLLLLLLLLCEG